MTTPPGSIFNYNSGSTHLLSHIINISTGLDPYDFAQKYLFQIIGIEEKNLSWLRDSSNLPYGGFGLSLRSRDLAKIGQLILSNGNWGNNQIFSKEWINKSSTLQKNLVDINNNSINYGYLFWIEEFGGFSAVGYNGQYITIIPEYDLVVIMTASGTYANHIIPEYIIPAIKDGSEKNSDFWNLNLIIYVGFSGITLVFIFLILVHIKKKVVEYS